MPYTARLIDNAEKERFDEFMARHSKGHVLQTWGWGELKNRTGWKPWRLVLEDHGEIVAAISILERKIPVVGIPIFYASRGPVLDWTNHELFDALLLEVKKLAQKRGAIFLKIDPDVPSSDKDLENYLKSRGSEVQKPARASKEFNLNMSSVWTSPLTKRLYWLKCTRRPAIILN